VIAIAQLARTVSIDFKFPEHINQGLSALTRSTKEAALLLSGSSFRSMADETSTPKPHSGNTPSSLSSILSPMNISPMTISPNYTPSIVSPNMPTFPVGSKENVQIRQGPPGAEGRMQAPPIVSIPLPREQL
jgi:hypothetical protein